MKIFKEIIKFILIFTTVFAVVFAIINYPAILLQSKFYWKKIFHKNELNSTSYLPEVKTIPQPTAQSLNLENNHIIIKKLDMEVPVVWDSPEQDFMKNLQNGVVHYKGTAKPGEKGNIFIAGHSSSYWWQRGPYSAIFSSIHKLEKGDEIIITYNNKVYIYQVLEKFTVKPTQVEVMSPTEIPTLTLMTCTPIGTALNRLIIRAQQIIP